MRKKYHQVFYLHLFIDIYLFKIEIKTAFVQFTIQIYRHISVTVERKKENIL